MKHNRLLFILVVSILLITLCSCDDAITEGEVYEKEYKDDFTTVMSYPVVISNGKTVSTIIVPYTVHYPERYVIRIRDYIDDQWVTEDFYVEKEVYDSINVGDIFKFDKDRGDLKDEPYTKEKQE